MQLQAEPSVSTGTPSRLLLDYSQVELEALASGLGEPAYRGRQLFAALMRQRCTAWTQITALPKQMRARLEQNFTLQRPLINAVEVADDGTRKYRLLSPGKGAFEAVYIPEVAKGRNTNTLCISSQTGCTVGCRFCFTAAIKPCLNLSAGEMVGQVLAVQDDLLPLGPAAAISNLVFMGMGEPLLNYEAVVKAVRILLDPAGPSFSSRRITISTAGIVPRIYDLARDLPTQLAVSLNATCDEVRSSVMPINKKWPLQQLLAAMRAYPLGPRRHITVEYVLLQGVNDSPADARRLTQLLAAIPVKINLLPLNAHPHTSYQPPSPTAVHDFQQILRDAGMNVIIRTPRGRDISAACGQLGGCAKPPQSAVGRL